MSANTGFNPNLKTQDADIINDLGETMISSPFLNFKTLNASSNATLPLLNATAYLFPI